MMFKSILYKEWLKIRIVTVLSLLTGILFIVGIYMTVRHNLLLTNANTYWNNIINREYIYFSILEYIPLIMGLLIGAAQFIPEMVDKRIKLTLHLPLNEDTIVLKMVSFGLAVITAMFLVLFLLFYGWGLYYFPAEIVNMAALTILPWFLAGLAAYLFSTFIILEPLWKYRIFYILFAAAFLRLFFKSTLAGAYQPVLLFLVVLIGLCSISTGFSIYRFRKGEM